MVGTNAKARKDCIVRIFMSWCIFSYKLCSDLDYAVRSLKNMSRKKVSNACFEHYEAVMSCSCVVKHMLA